jgi:LCP family protein required for cell wall assembly
MSDDATNQPRRSEERLARLGQEIDGTTGTPRTRKEQRQARAKASSRTGRRRKRWSTKRKVVTILASLAVLLALVVGGGYAYFRYEWNKIHKVACTTCVAAISGKPFNVLIVGSDTRAGNTGQAASSFGTSAAEGGQRSDTIKIVRVDPASGTARVLSIPRDTFVTMSGLAESTGLTGPNKINAAFNNGPNALIETIKNTFGISINHYVVVDFNGVIDSVNALNGISLNFKDPVRDFNTQTGVNESGLDIALPGCHLLNGNQVLSLSRSRYYQYYANGQWNSDNGYDIARIQRQNIIIEAMVKKASSTYNPFTLRALLDSVTHDITIDTQMSPSLLYDLAEKYHAFSPSSLVSYTLPTTPYSNAYGDILVVNTESSPTYIDTITQFLGEAPAAPTTPPLDASVNPVTVPTTTTTTAPASTSTAKSTSHTTTTTSPAATNSLPSYDPTLC